MLDETPSRTAITTTFLRAVHVRLDDPPPVLNDHLADRLLPGYLRRYLRSRALIPKRLSGPFRWHDPIGMTMRAQIVVRARYAEDCLSEARLAGAARYIVLGAGLDTYALRQPASRIPVIEIDHPATQRWKKRLLQQRDLTPPPELVFLPVDFERTTLDDAWIHSDRPDFISWLGTTYYLTRAGLETTLRTLARRTAPGSGLVLDYWSQHPGRTFDPLLLGVRIATASQGEPMRTFFEPGDMETLAAACGWKISENLSAAEQTGRYLAHRRDGLRVPAFAHLLRLERAPWTESRISSNSGVAGRMTDDTREGA